MSPTITLILDLLIAGLLIATIVYAIILNRQLINLHESRFEMEGLIRSFNEATTRAENGIKGMKRAAAETGEGLQKAIERAAQIRDELTFLIEAGDAVAQRLADPSAPQARNTGQNVVARRPSAAEPTRRAEASARAEPRPEPPARSPETRPEPLRPERPNARRLPDLEDVSQDLPRGRGILTRGDLESTEPLKSRSEAPRGDGARGEPGRRPGARNEGIERPLLGDEARPARREGSDGLSRAERELLEAMENRR